MSTDAHALLSRHARMRSADTLLVIFGDQLMPDHPGLARLDPERDAILMVEVDAEQQEGPSHKARTAMFLSAMRHYAVERINDGWRVRYVTLDNESNTHSFAGEVERAVGTLSPNRMLAMHPGDWRVMHEIESWTDRFSEAGVEAVEILDDPHFFTTPDDFVRWAEGRKTLTMEYWYREQRRATGYLMDGKEPIGGEWNFDKENRESFKKTPTPPRPYRPQLDEITREVIDLVNRRFADAPGELSEESFVWPVTTDQAERALDRFIEQRLDVFGPYEDAMWTASPFLFHSVLSPALNLHLLDPRRCCEKAIRAYQSGDAQLRSVEGFVRQLIGWREYIRGVYWHEGPGYRERNFLDQHGRLPAFFWDADTDMRCLHECLQPVVEHAYAHHIPRLMVLCNFAMIAGVHPREIGDWFYGMFADAVDWATAPNTIGMGMHCDGVRAEKNGKAAGVESLPVVGTKPYAASGKYIKRMSNFCEHCRYDVNARTGDLDAERPPCPFNVLYWDFLIRHEQLFKTNNRMAMIMKNVQRMNKQERVEITVSAGAYRERFGIEKNKQSAAINTKGAA